MDFQRLMREERDVLLRKWEPFLEGIEDEYIVENTAILLENEARYLAEAPEFAATGTGDIQGLQKIMLPIVRRVFPNLIANNIVSVQPIAAPSGIIFYLKYQYGTDRPGNPAGYGYDGSTGTTSGIDGRTGGSGNTSFPEYSMFENNPGNVEGYNPYYSSDEIGPFSVTSAKGALTEGVPSGNAAAATITIPKKYLEKWPASGESAFGTIEEYDVDGSAVASYSFYKDGSGYVVKGVDKLEGTTGRFEVTSVSLPEDGEGSLTVEPFTSGSYSYVHQFKVQAFYKTDMEFSENIPEMRITIGSVPVMIKTRKLKA